MIDLRRGTKPVILRRWRARVVEIWVVVMPVVIGIVVIVVGVRTSTRWESVLPCWGYLWGVLWSWGRRFVLIWRRLTEFVGYCTCCWPTWGWACSLPWWLRLGGAGDCSCWGSWREELSCLEEFLWMGSSEYDAVGINYYLLRFCVPGVEALLSAYLCAKRFHCGRRKETYAGRASGLVPLL